MVIAHLYVLNIPGKNTGILSKAPTKSINDPMIVRSIETRHSVAFLSMSITDTERVTHMEQRPEVTTPY